MFIDNNQIILFIVITCALIFLLAGIIIAVLYIYQRKQLIHQKEFNSLKLEFEKNLLRSHIEIQEQTFQNISREIHDNISLSLTLAKLNLNTLNWLSLDNAYTSVKSSSQIITTSIEDLSNLSRSLNPELIRGLGLMKALRNEVEKIRKMAHLMVNYEIKGEPIFMDSEKELIVFRIIQEAFNNILKHAQATRIWLELNYCPAYLDILIKDNGIGFLKEEISSEKGIAKSGFTNMETRAKLFGGKLYVESQPRSGTQVLVNVPYN